MIDRPQFSTRLGNESRSGLDVAMLVFQPNHQFVAGISIEVIFEAPSKTREREESQLFTLPGL